MDIVVAYDGFDKRGLPIRVLKKGSELRMLDYHAFIASEALESSDHLDELEAQWRVGRAPVAVIESGLSRHLSSGMSAQIRLLVA